jgi:Protein of unknown function (DUF2690)
VISSRSDSRCPIWRTCRGVVVIAALMSAGLASPSVVTSSAAAATCSAARCTNQDPYATGCSAGDSVAGTGAIVDGSGQGIGELKLYWSPSCEANWGQAYFNDGNPPSTPPVDVKVVGSSSAGAYDTGPVDFTTPAAGSPVWGNMVDSPGCAYATVTRGGASGTAVQLGCSPPGPRPPSPVVLTLPTPTTKCTGTLCDGQDPYHTACSNDAASIGSSPILDQGRSVGTLQLYASAVCEAVWGQASFYDDNPATTPPVDVRVVGSDASATMPYDRHAIDYSTTGSGSPVWGNLAYSAGCAYATVTRGNASGEAIQAGCPSPGGPAPSGTLDLSTMTGDAIQVAGGTGVHGIVARFTYADAAERSNNFVATIDWGDGSGEVAGQVVALNGEGWVNGSHRYPDPTQPGQATAAGYVVTATVTDDAGGALTATTQVEVVGNGLPVTEPADGTAPAISSSNEGRNVGETAIDILTCAGGIATAESGVGAAVAGADCGLAITGLAGLIGSIFDPRADEYRHVFTAAPISLARLPKGCAHLRRRLCTEMHASARRYLRASAATATLSKDVGVTAMRFDAAAKARSRSAERLQRHAERRYLIAFQKAVAARRKAGRAFGILIQRHRLDSRITAQQALSGRFKLLSLRGLSRGYLRLLRHAGVSRAELRALVKRELGWASSPTDTTLSSLLAL